MNRHWKEALGSVAQRCVVGVWRCGNSNALLCVPGRDKFFFKALVDRLWYPKCCRSARASPVAFKRLVAWRQENWVLPHPRLVVPAPDSDVFYPARQVGVPRRRAESAPLRRFHVDKSPVATSSADRSIVAHQAGLVLVHCALLPSSVAGTGKGQTGSFAIFVL